MKKPNLNLVAFLFVALAFAVSFSACKKDDDPVAGPKVTAPATQNIKAEESVDLTFNYTAAAGFKSAAIVVENGSADIKTNGTDGATSGAIVVTFTAGTTTGAASVKLTVTDKNNAVDDATGVVNVGTEEMIVYVNSNITADETWTTGKVYVLKSRIAVVNGVTLTIEPGVIVKGEAGTQANATALLIARGAKLMAEGTAQSPIIFTSVADEIMPGEIASPNLAPDVAGLWGGLLILGNARISASNESGDVSEVQIEGIPTSDPNGLYGGNDNADNSGVIKYISIRHGGTDIGAGNEINGLSLGGVGSGTVIENVEIVSNQDDGIEFFGGTVNLKNAVVWNVNDDAIDTDQSYNGTVDNFIILSPTGHNFELDGPEGSYQAGHIIKNGTVVCSDDEFGRVASDLINVDANSIVDLQNIYFTAIVEGQMINRVTAEGVAFNSIMLNVAAGDLASHVNGDVPAGVTAGGTPQADATVFGWTWASVAGKLAGL
ncbi:MAG: hypothetical protein KKF98_16755 [Bacteroidetes bacterium]|nr:hypothetical protein [Bacteroidota bacterium]